MLTEQALKEIERDLQEARTGKKTEAGMSPDKTGHSGGEDPPGMKPTDDDPEKGASTDSSIKALAKEDFKERDDFFKLSQIIKGLAAVSDKDQAAKDFLVKVGEAVRDLAGGGEGGNPKDDNRTEPGQEEPLKNHPKREQPGNKASQIDVEKGLPGSTEDLGESFMPTGQIKALNAVSGQLSKLTKKMDSELNRLLDEIQGGIDDDNKKRVGRMLQSVMDAWADMAVLMDNIEKNLKSIRSNVKKEDVDLREDLSPLVLAEMLDTIIEKSEAEPITGRQWQELRGFADFISKDAARVAKAVASKDPAEILDKAKTMVTNVEILIKRMAGIYPSMDKVADMLDKAGREMMRVIR